MPSMMHLCHSIPNGRYLDSACPSAVESLHTGEEDIVLESNVKRIRAASSLILLCGALSACGGDPKTQTDAALQNRNAENEISDESIFDLFRMSDKPKVGVAVNQDIWQASLDILSFLPLESADPFSGLIITGWGRLGGDPTPYRVTVYVSSPALDARSLKVAAFRQQGGRAVAVAEEDNRRLEDAILTRARQNRIAEATR